MILNRDNFIMEKNNLLDLLSEIKSKANETFFLIEELILEYKFLTKIESYPEISGKIVFSIDYLNKPKKLGILAEVQRQMYVLRQHLTNYLAIYNKLKELNEAKNKRDKCIIQVVKKTSLMPPLKKAMNGRFKNYDSLSQMSNKELLEYLDSDEELDYLRDYEDILDCYNEGVFAFKVEPLEIEGLTFASINELEQVFEQSILNNLNNRFIIDADIKTLMKNKLYAEYNKLSLYMMFKSFKENKQDDFNNQYYEFRKRYEDIKKIAHKIFASITIWNFDIEKFYSENIDLIYDPEVAYELPRLKSETKKIKMSDWYVKLSQLSHMEIMDFYDNFATDDEELICALNYIISCEIGTEALNTYRLRKKYQETISTNSSKLQENNAILNDSGIRKL